LLSPQKLLSIKEKFVLVIQQWIQGVIGKSHFVQKSFHNHDLPLSLIFGDFYGISFYYPSFFCF